MGVSVGLPVTTLEPWWPKQSLLTWLSSQRCFLLAACAPCSPAPRVAAQKGKKCLLWLFNSIHADVLVAMGAEPLLFFYTMVWSIYVIIPTMCSWEVTALVLSSM